MANFPSFSHVYQKVNDITLVDEWYWYITLYDYIKCSFTSIYIHLHFYMAMDQYLLSTIFSGMNIHFNPAILM